MQGAGDEKAQPEHRNETDDHAERAMGKEIELNGTWCKVFSINSSPFMGVASRPKQHQCTCVGWRRPTHPSHTAKRHSALECMRAHGCCITPFATSMYTCGLEASRLLRPHRPNCIELGNACVRGMRAKTSAQTHYTSSHQALAQECSNHTVTTQ